MVTAAYNKSSGSPKKKRRPAAKPTSPSPAKLAKQAFKYLRAKALGKKHYARADRLVGDIARAVPAGAEIKLNGDGRTLLLIDNFVEATANKKYPNPTAWNICAARRFELVEKSGGGR